ncbi:unnamed protein product [Cylicocyclus nassatus]|uniref:Uncharacterized protein n=1 Tax=Cylicocyclus nassatus TaxID=53992 RepID=A0AA36GL18_CYLNA|nr:unnamed protein product [Cylicocyclus nassatus]
MPPVMDEQASSNSDELITAICLSVTSINDNHLAECYSIQKRRLYRIHLPDDRACKSWELQFVLRNADANGVYYVDKFDVPEQSPLENKSVVIGSDGVVKLQAYVSISYCAHHESYERKVFWSEQFGRVLAGEDVANAQRYVIYSTRVER